MSADLPAVPLPDASPELVAMAMALTELNILLQRRRMAAVASLGADASRGREELWCAIEAMHAALQGTTLTHKDLTALAHGAISGPTLTRALASAEKRGMLRRRAAAHDRRVTLIEPTAKSYEFFFSRAQEGFQAVAELIHATERRCAVLAASSPAPVPVPAPEDGEPLRSAQGAADCCPPLRRCASRLSG